MFDEIEQFIRKAAQAAQEAANKAKAQQEGRPQPQRPAQPQRPQQQQRPPQQRAPVKRLAEQVQPPGVLEAKIEDPHELTSRSLPSARLSSIAGEHLAQNVEQADDKMDAHVQQVFEHKLGRLKEQVAEPQAVNIAGIDLIAKMLSNQRDLRNAIILSEILKRPEHF